MSPLRPAWSLGAVRSVGQDEFTTADRRDLNGCAFWCEALFQQLQRGDVRCGKICDMDVVAGRGLVGRVAVGEHGGPRHTDLQPSRGEFNLGPYTSIAARQLCATN